MVKLFRTIYFCGKFDYFYCWKLGKRARGRISHVTSHIILYVLCCHVSFYTFFIYSSTWEINCEKFNKMKTLFYHVISTVKSQTQIYFFHIEDQLYLLIDDWLHGKVGH